MAYVTVQRDSDGVQWIPKDPEAVLDFMFDWAGLEHENWPSNWLQPGEVIVSFNLTVPVGIVEETSSISLDQLAVIVWLSGGTVCESYDVDCQITTNIPRTDSRKMRVKVVDR